MNKYMVILPDVHYETVEADFIEVESGVVILYRVGVVKSEGICREVSEIFAVYPHGVIVQKVEDDE